jgi:BMFP domain-containing protein YqiC
MLQRRAPAPIILVIANLDRTIIMQTDNRLFDDLARAANGALGALAGLRAEFETHLRSWAESWLKSQNLVAREEFEVVRSMAAKARMENEALTARIAALEAQLAARSETPKGA